MQTEGSTSHWALSVRGEGSGVKTISIQRCRVRDSKNKYDGNTVEES